MTFDGPVDRFCDSLDELIDRFRESPLDDRLTLAEVVGVLEIKKLELIVEHASEEQP